MKSITKYLIIIIIFVFLAVICNLEELVEKKESEEVKLGKLVYTIPILFKKSRLSKENANFYSYTNKYSQNTCNFSVTVMKPFNTDLDIIVQAYMFTEKKPIIKEKTINNQVWKWSSDSTKIKGEYYSYATIYQDYLYVIQYDDMKLDSSCDKMLRNIMKSLKMEE